MYFHVYRGLHCIILYSVGQLDIAERNENSHDEQVDAATGTIENPNYNVRMAMFCLNTYMYMRKHVLKTVIIGWRSDGGLL